MVHPKSLQKGDKIKLISTARKVSPDEIKDAITTFESWGLSVTLGSSLFNEDHQFAGTDEERAKDLQNAINDPSIHAIICVRGGYGTDRIVDRIDFSAFLTHPKWIVGFSDVTVLHNHIHNLGVITIHSTMPLLFSKPEQKEAIKSLHDALFGHPIRYTIPTHSLSQLQNIEGTIVGGNLSIVNNLIGTPSDIDTTDKILFLEDLDEYLYHIDRMMMHLKRSGKLSLLRALVIGHFSDMNDNTIPFGKSAEEIVIDITKEYNFPIFFNFPAGHLNNNLAIKLGQHATFEIIQNGVIFKQ